MMFIEEGLPDYGSTKHAVFVGENPRRQAKPFRTQLPCVLYGPTVFFAALVWV